MSFCQIVVSHPVGEWIFMILSSIFCLVIYLIFLGIIIAGIVALFLKIYRFLKGEPWRSKESSEPSPASNCCCGYGSSCCGTMACESCPLSDPNFGQDQSPP